MKINKRSFLHEKPENNENFIENHEKSNENNEKHKGNYENPEKPNGDPENIESWFQKRMKLSIQRKKRKF